MAYNNLYNDDLEEAGASDVLQTDFFDLTIDDSGDELEAIANGRVDHDFSTAGPGSAPYGSKRRRQSSSSSVGDVVCLPDVLEDSCRMSRKFAICVGDTVELQKKGTESEENEEDVRLNSGDFFRIKYIIRNVQTDEYRLRGFRLRRSKYFGQTFDWKLNELILFLRVNEDDPRPWFVQGLEEVRIDDVLDKRDLVMTNRPYPFSSFREIPIDRMHFSSSWSMKQHIFHHGRLACRYVYILIHHRNGKAYSGEVRRVYAHESDHKVQAPAIGTSRSSSIQVDEEENRSQSPETAPTNSRKRRERSPSLELLGNVQKFRSKIPVKRGKYTFADCFCGAGGTSRGAEMAGLEILWGLDMWDKACEAYEKNFESAGIYEMSAHDFPPRNIHVRWLRPDILHLSPPCCYFSPVHTNAGKNDQANYEALWTVGPLLQKLKPKLATLEQTFGLISINQHMKTFKALLNQIVNAGYNCRYMVVNMLEYGVPQKRKRLIIIAARNGVPLPQFPNATHGVAGSGLKRFCSVWDGLEPLRAMGPNYYEEHHRPYDLKELSKEPYDAKSWPLKGCITGDGGAKSVNYHPDGGRAFTVRELALFQTFPLKHKFVGGKRDATLQVGNAYPPLMASIIFKQCIKTLDAFKHGLIDAEEEVPDLDYCFDDKGRLNWQQNFSPSPAPSQQSGSAQSPSLRSTFRSSSLQDPSRFRTKLPFRDVKPKRPRQSLFGQVEAIEPEVTIKEEKKSAQLGKKMLGKNTLTDAEKIFFAEANGEIVELD